MTIFSARAHDIILRRVEGLAPVPRHPEFSSVRAKTLNIDNIVYQSPIFRKIHLEVAGNNADTVSIVHLVLHPRTSLPILSMDVVVLSGRPTMCIADPCPGNIEGVLPPAYEEAVLDLQRRHDIRSTREMPEWGREIFSKTCCIITHGEEYEKFQEYALDLLEYHLGAAAAGTEATTTTTAVGTEAEATATTMGTEAVATPTEAHERYRTFQMKNEKTRKMLTGVFDGDAAKAEAYMRYVFD